jgi:dienelactone hydrolase
MQRLTCFVIFLVIILTAATLAAEPVTFAGLSLAPGVDQLILKANLVKPEGDGPFPAVIMMHGCAGDSPYLDAWEKRIVQWGYVVLRVDSLTPRKQQTFCDNPMATVRPRAQDAYDAKAYLMGLPFVDEQKIGLVGWSHGAMAALLAVDDSTSVTDRKTPFQCAVSFYPYCSSTIKGLNAPLLVLIGEKDDWCPSFLCESLPTSNKSPFDIEVKIYENATHCFDWEGMDKVYMGHTLKYNPEAAGDAVARVQTFLVKYLK